MVFCFDIGGTSIKYGAAHEENGTINFALLSEEPTDAKKTGGPGIAAHVKTLISDMKDMYHPEGIAISTAGIVDSRRGKITYANENIPDYTGWDWKSFIEDSFHLPCSVENDVNCAALGETIYGAGQGADSVVCMTVGTGIGGAVVLDKKIWPGHTGCAGEVGYMPVDGMPFEKAGSTSALVEKVRKRTGRLLSGKQIFDLAKKGDMICQEAINEMCAVLAKGIAVSVCLLDPEMVILGGGVMAQEDYLAPLIREHLRESIDDVISKRCRIVFAELGNTAGMAGAFYCFKNSWT